MFLSLLFAADSEVNADCLQARRNTLVAKAEEKLFQAKYRNIQLQELLDKGFHELLPKMSEEEILNQKIKLSTNIKKMQCTLGSNLANSYAPLPLALLDISDKEFWRIVYKKNKKSQLYKDTHLINIPITNLRELFLQHKVDLAIKRAEVVCNRTKELCKILTNTVEDKEFYQNQHAYFKMELNYRYYLNEKDSLVEQSFIFLHFPKLCYYQNIPLPMSALERLLLLKQEKHKMDYLFYDPLVKSLLAKHNLELRDTDAIAYFIVENYQICLLELSYNCQKLFNATIRYMRKTTTDERMKLKLQISIPHTPEPWLDYTEKRQDLDNIRSKLLKTKYKWQNNFLLGDY